MAAGSAPLISFVVPVYNGEACVGRCLKSLIDQAAGDLEMIVVDDGSTDSTVRVVNDIAAGSPVPLRLVSQANQGPGAARNHGLALANGRYVCFLDADDYVADDFLATRFAALASGPVDIVLIPEDQDRRDAWHGPVGRVRCEDFIEARLALGALHSSVIGNLYGTEFLRRQGIEFPATYATEDKYFSLCALMGAEWVAVLPHSSYVVTRDNAQSLSSRGNDRRLAQAHWKIAGLLVKKFEGVALSHTKRQLVDERAEYLLFSALRKSRHLPGLLAEARHDPNVRAALDYFALHSRKFTRRLRARFALGLGRFHRTDD